METYAITIRRYNPETDDQPTMQDYTVPRVEQGTVLEGLQYIYEEVDSTLLFTYGCRYKVCGKCAIKINGWPGLACDTDLEDRMVLEPLDNFPVIRDLSVDRSVVFNPLKELDIILSSVEETEVVNQSSRFFDFVTCTECLSCLSVCPVFAVEKEGNGPLFRVKLAELFYDVRDGKERYDQLSTFYDCTTCQSCSTVCPQEISLDDAVCEVRKAFFNADRAPESMLGVRDSIVSNGNVFASPQEERTEIYPRAVKEKIKAGKLKKTAETLLFMGCVSSYLDMKIVPSFLMLMEAAGVDYTTLGEEEVCCGFPLYLMGSGEFESHARGLIERIKATGARQLVTPCAGCYKTFRKLYPEIADLGVEVYLSVHYVEKLLAEGKIDFSKELKKTVTYHDPCDIGRTFGIYEEPRNILSRIPGIDFVEMERNREQARCCGGGGNVQAHDPEMAVRMAAERVRDALAVGAEIIVSACPACKDNLRKGAQAIPKEERGKIKVMDITEVVKGAMG